MATVKSSKSGLGQLTSRADAIAALKPGRTGPLQGRPTRGRIFGDLRVLLKTDRADGVLLDCEVLHCDGTVMGTIVVARPRDMQTTFYDGQTQGGVTFANVDKSTRTATDGSNPDETHKITPDYIEGVSVLDVQQRVNGTGLLDDVAPNVGRDVLWQDITPQRGWAVDSTGGGG